METKLSYWEIREMVSKTVPRMTVLSQLKKKTNGVKEKGRKRNYQQFNLKEQEWRKQERLLNTEEINNFLEISLRAQACPMPFNLDIWDGLTCIAKGQDICTRLGNVVIEDVKPGDEVLSYNEVTEEVEWKPVLKTSCSMKHNMVELETSIGMLRLTADHRVFTQRGWVEAGKLTMEDVVYSYV